LKSGSNRIMIRRAVTKDLEALAEINTNAWKPVIMIYENSL